MTRTADGGSAPPVRNSSAGQLLISTSVIWEIAIAAAVLAALYGLVLWLRRRAYANIAAQPRVPFAPEYERSAFFHIAFTRAALGGPASILDGTLLRSSDDRTWYEVKGNHRLRADQFQVMVPVERLTAAQKEERRRRRPRQVVPSKPVMRERERILEMVRNARARS